jgi:chemotaxis protein methyltransferase CheR
VRRRCKMNIILSKNEFVVLKDYIHKTSGIHITDDKEYLIQNRLLDIMNQEKIDSFSALCERVIVERDLLLSQKVIDAITTNETSWFRDRGTWNLFEEKFMPEFVKALNEDSSRKIKIWSCACSTGQEPYTIGMVIDDYLFKNKLDMNLKNRFSILATDISERSLQVAVKAEYNEAAMERGLDPYYKRNYFSPVANTEKWVLREDIKRMVHFESLNLNNMFYFNAKGFSLAFVRNVLIYFNNELKGTILDRVALSLDKEASLLIGASELIQNKNFERVEHKGNVYYKLLNG